MSVRLMRRGSARCIALLSAVLMILLCLYYVTVGQQQQQQQLDQASVDVQRLAIGDQIVAHKRFSPQNRSHPNAIVQPPGSAFGDFDGDRLSHFDSDATARPSTSHLTCPRPLETAATDITTGDEFARFDFQPEWMKSKEYWDRSFESRFETLRKDAARPPLKVILMPHSHNDPGWLKTYLGYFQSDTRQILNQVITKMHEYTDMTFIWSEMSYLQLWWDQAHPTRQRALRQLIQQGRFEITTGGWVMTDEANVHLFAMVDQLIEGHQWCREQLNYTPTTGWSIDPFGHGSTVPYLLSASGFTGTIIQRVHYAWKQWLAKHQNGDFVWTPVWRTPDDDEVGGGGGAGGARAAYTPPDARGGTLLTHNMPFDIYSIKHSCGPHPYVCLNFDFRKVPGEYTEYSIKAQAITDDNVEAKADLLLEQYARTASLYAHNVALIPIGDDFRYNKDHEVEQQYTNYKKLIDYINAHRERYQTEIAFGLPRDYFAAIAERQGKFPTLKGDFFVYSDIFSEGRPAYWSGYYATRPSYKMLGRDLEHQLRSLEILFTIAFNRARQQGNYNALRVFEKNYEKLIGARRNLGLFQHHDAITGTSKAAVMRDYGQRLFESIRDAVRLQESAIELLVQEHVTNEHGFVLAELERESFNRLARKVPIVVPKAPPSAEGAEKVVTDPLVASGGTDFVVYNSLAQDRLEVVALRTLVPNVEVVDADGVVQAIQVNPVWNITDLLDSAGIPIAGNGNGGAQSRRLRISHTQYEVLFVARLPGLSLRTFTMRQLAPDTTNTASSANRATVYCNNCTDGPNANANNPHKSPAPPASVFDIRPKQAGDIQLENGHMRLLFDEQTGFLRTVTPKNAGRAMQCAIKFAAYSSAQFHSGAYLFKIDPERQPNGNGDASGANERDVLQAYESDVSILITSGPVASDVTVVYGRFLAHTVRVFSTHTALDRAVYIENDIDFEPPPKNRETELFMRFVTDIENAADAERPEIYTDQNGFQFHRRRKVPAVGVEGNYYPITTAAFMQDDRRRLTLVTQHAQGAAGLAPGQLEVMLDRRTLYDDSRGMGEGVVDSRLARHRFWLLLEEFESGDGRNMTATATTKKPSSTTADAKTTTTTTSTTDAPAEEYALPTLFANQLSNALNYPANVYFIENNDAAGVADSRDSTGNANGARDDSIPTATHRRRLQRDVRLLADRLPCDMHLVNLRTLTDAELPLFPSPAALMVVQRQGFSCRTLRRTRKASGTEGVPPFGSVEDGCSEADGMFAKDKQSGRRQRRVDGVQLFDGVRVQRMDSTLLTGLRTHEEIRRWSAVRLEPMELRTFNVSFAQAAAVNAAPPT